MTQELFEMPLSKREELVARISEIMREEFDVSTNSINDFWARVSKGVES